MIHHGDCLDVMAGMEAASVDAIVTDPPYGLEFMGKEWDRLAPAVGRGPLRPTPESTGPIKSEFKQGVGTRMGAPQKNPRCRLCGKLKFDHPKGKCKCAAPDFDTRQSEYAFLNQVWHQAWATEAFRVAKPGAYLLAFGGTRTYHRMTCAIEDAGWIIRDCLVWAYASGFPKSRALLKPAWEPIVMARKPGPLRELAIDACRIGTEPMPHLPGALGANGIYGQMVRRPTATMDAWDDARNLCGSCAADADSPERPGTAGTRGSTTRKPAARMPNGSATSTATSRPGTGCSDGTTVDGTATSSSIGGFGSRPTGLFLPDTSSTMSTATSSTTGLKTCRSCGATSTGTTTIGTGPRTPSGQPEPTTSGSTESAGRWPSNLILTDPIFDGDTPGVVGGGWQQSQQTRTSPGNLVGESMFGNAHRGDDYLGDSGTYSRFFLIPKADRAEREPVLSWELDRRDRTTSHVAEGRTDAFGEKFTRSTLRFNAHPTVKPLDLMRHLVRLVTPTDGLVLDPFLGSGTTGLAAEMEGFRWVGIEREAEYVAIAEARLNGTQRGLGI